MVNTPDKFWSMVDIRSEDKCWPWLGNTKIGKRGGEYGYLSFEGKNRLAHRVAFKLTMGHYPEPMGRHLCDNDICCNPLHVIEGTHSDNMKDKSLRIKRFNALIHDDLF